MAGTTFQALLAISVFGLVVIGLPALGIYNLTKYHQHAGDSLLTRIGPAKAGPAMADDALWENCRPDGECPKADLIVYRRDEGPFHDYLKQVIIRHGGTYAIDDEGTYLAVLPSEQVRQPLDIAAAPMRQGVSAGYAEWAEQTVVEAAPNPPPNRHGIYITVSGHCTNCLVGWVLIATGLIMIVIIIGCIVAGPDTDAKRSSG